MPANYGETSQEIYPPKRGCAAWSTKQLTPLGQEGKLG